MLYPRYVVVDLVDDYVFWRDANGDQFDRDTAQAFVDLRNDEKVEKTYHVAVLTILEA